MFITHFFIASKHRKDIKRFHDFFHAFKEIARAHGKPFIRTSIHTETKRWRALLYIEQKVAKFKITDKTDDEYFLEYKL